MRYPVADYPAIVARFADVLGIGELPGFVQLNLLARRDRLERLGIAT